MPGLIKREEQTSTGSVCGLERMVPGLNPWHVARGSRKSLTLTKKSLGYTCGKTPGKCLGSDVSSGIARKVKKSAHARGVVMSGPKTSHGARKSIERRLLSRSSPCSKTERARDGAAGSKCPSEDTGGTCRIFLCSRTRGPTMCSGGKCLCRPGLCAEDHTSSP